MTACPTCGEDPCVNPAFCQSCQKAEAKRMTRDYVGEALGETKKSWRDGLITAKDLQTKTFAPVRIILPELIPEGITLLAGKPKIGKSFFALDVCMAVAANRFVLGETKPVQGDALYLALEDNQRRLKQRVDMLLQSAQASERLQLHTEWKRVDQGGLADIEDWIKSVAAPRLIWVDTLAKIRPTMMRNEQPYASDYRAIEGLQKLAGQYSVGIVINTHLRKAPSEDDPFDEVSGTTGLSGASDTIIVMKRHSGMVKVYVRGRDIEEKEFAAEFNKNTFRWRLVGEAKEVFRSAQRQAIAAALKEAGRSMSVSDIMAATERQDRNGTEVLLHKMEKDGEVLHAGRGLWIHPDVKAAPIDPVKNVKIVRNGNQGSDNKEESDADESYRNLNDANKTVKIPEGNLNAQTGVKIGVKIPESRNPLTGNGRFPESYRLNNLNGPERRDPWRPALGPPGDNFDDFISVMASS